ncbi:hypothetical protein [Paraglaciecola sp. MB-3u-78]|jgi:hypothetical protein|uniref:hypothetical protein n=1 Tax=Paraglaciecola sp. MB-3u-78 TaxID=2058332 RepID=UPI000C34A9D3|nr:hypothetical protein [Paraglaciecola sp. MB-3u-78]PKG96165.1 hypothetical protein CXF95_24780 [Paraglaciecola sp. MB-3u-78]
MNNKIMTFETIRWVSIAAMLAVVSYGFFTPISIIQALVYNPMLIIGLLSIAGYVSGRIESMKQTAEIHHLVMKDKQTQQTICRAA